MGKYLVFGIITFIIGFVTASVAGGIFGQSGDGIITASVFNSGIAALVSAVLFLSAVVVVCTLMLAGGKRKGDKA